MQRAQAVGGTGYGYGNWRRAAGCCAAPAFMLRRCWRLPSVAILNFRPP